MPAYRSMRASSVALGMPLPRSKARCVDCGNRVSARATRCQFCRSLNGKARQAATDRAGDLTGIDTATPLARAREA